MNEFSHHPSECPHSLNDLADLVYTTAAEHGFHNAHENPSAEQFGLMLALIHSEVSEALESYRKGEQPYFYEPDSLKPEGWGIELMDALIRILDTLQTMGAGNIDDMFWEKHLYNKLRPFLHGKAF